MVPDHSRECPVDDLLSVLSGFSRDLKVLQWRSEKYLEIQSTKISYRIFNDPLSYFSFEILRYISGILSESSILNSVKKKIDGFSW